MHIVDLSGISRSAEQSLTYITLPPLIPPKPLRPRPRPKAPSGYTVYFDYHAFAMPGPGAITVPNIANFVAKYPPKRQSRNCPFVLRPDSPEWKRLCAPKTNVAEGEEEADFDDPAIKRNAAIFARMEAELRRRHLPPKVPCAYTKKFANPPGGPHENSAAMADVGCALKEWFGR